MRIPYLGVIFVIWHVSVSIVQAEFDHRLLAQTGDIATDKVGLALRFPADKGGGVLHFSAFDPSNHFVTEDDEVIFRAQLENDTWGYWKATSTGSELLFLEGTDNPFDTQRATLYSSRTESIWAHATAPSSDGPDQFFRIADLNGLGAELQSIANPGIISSRWQFSNDGIMALFGSFSNSTIGHITASRTVPISSTEDEFRARGRTYKTTSLDYPAGSDSNATAFLAEGIHVSNDSTFVNHVSVLRYLSPLPGAEIETIFEADTLSLAALSISDTGEVAFKGRVDGSPWGIYAGNRLGQFRKVAEEGSLAPGTLASTFTTIRFFQVSDTGAVTLMAQDSNKRWGIWSEMLIGQNNYLLLPLVIEGMNSPYDENLTIDQLHRGVANDRNAICFLSTQDDLLGGHAGTTYWRATFNQQTGLPIHEPIVTEFEPELFLPDGKVVRASEISGLEVNLRTSSPHGVARQFNDRSKASFRIKYLHPATFETVDSLWISSPNPLVVNATGDAPDANPGDGVADTRTDTSIGNPVGTLRAAIQEANALGQVNSIEFEFHSSDIIAGTATIHPNSPLPKITAPIDFNTAPVRDTTGKPVNLVLDGSKITTGDADGLVFAVNDSYVYDLIVTAFSGHGIVGETGNLKLINVDSTKNGKNGIEAWSLIIDIEAPKTFVIIQANGASGILVHDSLEINGAHVLQNGDTGITSEGELLILNKSGGKPIHIRENGSSGIAALNATELLADEASITGNGKANPKTGFGLFLPNANVTLFNSVINDNLNTGIVASSADFFDVTTISNNGADGVDLAGNLNAEKIDISGNKGWGIQIEGQALSINEDDDGLSLIIGNELGGISFSGLELLVNNLDVRLNGTFPGIGSPFGEGIKAPMASATINHSRINQNAADGIIAKQLSIIGNPSIFEENGGNGATVSNNVIVEDGCYFLQNSGWGLDVDKGTVTLGSKGGTELHRFDENTLGGLRSQGPRIEAWLLEINENGLPSNLGDGLLAPFANAILNTANIKGNAGNGVKAQSADIKRANIERHGTDGVSLRSGPITMDGVALVSNSGSGLVVGDDILGGGGPSFLSTVLLEDNNLDGIRNESPFPMDITASSFLGNGRFAVTNSATVICNVIAIGNDWDHPTGPSGAAPGQGQPISRNVKYEEPPVAAPLEVTTEDSPYKILPGIVSPLEVLIRQTDKDQTVTLRASDTKGWLAPQNSALISIEMRDGTAETTLNLNPPNDVAIGESSELTIDVTIASTPLQGETVRTTVLLVVGQPAISRIEIRTPKKEITTEETLQLEALGWDHLDQPITFAPQWRILENPAGHITPNGLLTPPPAAGKLNIILESENGLMDSVQITVSLPEDPATDTNAPLPDPGTGVGKFRSRSGEIITFNVTGRGGQTLWGTNTYTDDSDIGIAAVHAGLLEIGETATVRALIAPGQSAYQGSERNNITSQTFGRWAGSFQLIPADIDLSQTIEIFNNTNEQVASSGPSEATAIVLDERLLLNRISTLHLDTNEPTTERTISLSNRDGQVFGPWRLTLENQEPQSRTTVWRASASYVLEPGTYTLVNSSIETWAHNGESGHQGFAIVSGVQLGSTTFPAPSEQEPVEPETGAGNRDILPDPSGGLTSFRSRVNDVLFFEVTGTDSGSIWGTSIYTDDSTLGKAAVHSGLATIGETTVVKVTILPGQSSYEGTLRNGIQSSPFSAWDASYKLESAIPITPPELTIARIDGNLVVTWNSEDLEFTLETTSILSNDTLWIPIEGVQRNANLFRYVVLAPETIQYFRLRK